MDLFKLVEQLHAERERLDRVIAALQAMQREAAAAHPNKSRRGRKGMGPAERRAVSERMRLYWANRRKAESASTQRRAAAAAAGEVE